MDRCINSMACDNKAERWVKMYDNDMRHGFCLDCLNALHEDSFTFCDPPDEIERSRYGLEERELKVV